jgi:predicted RNase H-like nuclease
VLATAAASGRGRIDIEVVPDFAAVVDRDLLVVAVDMPMGLVDAGVRACDVAARRALGPRRSSVFPAPARPLLACAGYADALAAGRALDGRGLSRQAWNLAPRIAEVDAVLSPSLQARIIEASPELSFATMAGAPLAAAKRTSNGAATRRGLVARHVGRLPVPVPRGARPDDVLDAAALVWTARRVAAGTALTLGDGGRDGKGLAMVVRA